MSKPILRGDRNQCAGCSQCFNSSHAFDKHRAGEFGTGRHCLTAEQMQAKGMVLREDGFWRGSAMPESIHNDDTAAQLVAARRGE